MKAKPKNFGVIDYTCCAFCNKTPLDFDEFFYLKDVFHDVNIVIEPSCGMHKVKLAWIFNSDFCINIYSINLDKMNITLVFFYH